MADLSLKYLLFGEDRTASKSIKGVGTQAGSTASLVAGGMSKLGSAVGGEVGDMIDQVSEGFSKLAEKSKGMGAKLAVGGAAITGLGAAFQTMASSDVEAQNQLKVAIDNTGNSYSDYKDKIEETIKKQEGYGNSAVQTQDALRVLTQSFGSPEKALKQMALTADLAASKHISLSEAAGIVAKAHGGAGKVFKAFGVTVGLNKDGTKNYDNALTALSSKIKGQAAASVDTFTGKLDVMRTKVTDSAAQFGQKYGPAITMAGVGITALGTVMQILAARQAAAAIATDLGTDAAARQSLGSKLAAAAQWLWNAAMTANPIGLVIAAIALLVGAIVLIATKTTWFQTIWEYTSHAIGAAWKWLWNTILQPVIKFILEGFSALATMIGKVLVALGNIPGFGWAKTAGQFMLTAAGGAQKLADNIKKIPDKKDVGINVRYYVTTSGKAPNLGGSAKGVFNVPGHAGGTGFFGGGLSWVGERGPELVSLPRGTAIHSNPESMAMARSGGNGAGRGPSAAGSSGPIRLHPLDIAAIGAAMADGMKSAASSVQHVSRNRPVWG